jgi:hypothetical protein
MGLSELEAERAAGGTIGRGASAGRLTRCALRRGNAELLEWEVLLRCRALVMGKWPRAPQRDLGSKFGQGLRNSFGGQPAQRHLPRTPKRP